MADTARGSLPHRQLRKCFGRSAVVGRGSLPHRQLRKFGFLLGRQGGGSLPHRQLRKLRAEKLDAPAMFTAA